MNEKPSLKKSQRFYNQDDYHEQYSDLPHPDESNASQEMSQEEIEDQLAVEQYVLEIVSKNVKEYCEKHFEEIIAGAIMIHELKQKRKSVKAKVLNKCT